MKPAYVVAIGGSADFLNPLLQIFEHTTLDHVSYVVLRHIGSSARSQLVYILQRHSKLKVRVVKEGMPIEKNMIYILPPGFYMTLDSMGFHLQKRTEVRNCAIDIFMESLAAEYKNKTFGIILSGSGNNGTKGIISIKKAGGKVLVQDPSTCLFEKMPESAIRSGYVDEIASPEQMPALIQQFIHNSHQQELAT